MCGHRVGPLSPPGGLPGPADASLGQPASLKSNRGGTVKAKTHVAREPKFLRSCDGSEDVRDRTEGSSERPD